MPTCELCGKAADIVVADIEGVELKVCAGCASHGTIKQRFTHQSKPMIPHPEGPEYRVVSTYASLLHSAREKKGMSQEDFAKFLREKESILAKWEAGTLKPNIESARRIGKMLGFSLVEKDEDAASSSPSAKKSEEPTLGDFVKVRTRK